MLCEKLGVCHEILAKYEADALGTFEQNAYRFEMKYIEKKCDDAKLCDEHKKLILEYMDFAGQNEELLKFLWLYYYFQFKTQECFLDRLWENGLDAVPVPMISENFAPGMLKSVVYLLASDHVLDFARENGMGDDYVDEYYANYKRLSEMNTVSHDTYGLCRLGPHVYGYAYPLTVSLGRLRYQIISFNDFCEVYEDTDGNRIVIALPVRTYNADGYQDESAAFCPTYHVENQILTAHTFDEAGCLCPEPGSYDLQKMKKILAPGDMVATIHIPREGRLLPELVDESLELAKRILPRCFEKYGMKGIVCKSWILDTQLCQVLSEKSNLLKFQKRFDLAMAEDNKNHSLFDHVFNVKPTTLEELVPQNEFQRKMLDRAKEGKKIYWGYGILKS